MPVMGGWFWAGEVGFVGVGSHSPIFLVLRLGVLLPYM